MEILKENEGYYVPWNGCYKFDLNEFYPSTRQYFNLDGSKYSCIMKKNGKYGLFKVMPTQDYGCSGLLAKEFDPICYDEISILTLSKYDYEDTTVIVFARRRDLWYAIDMSYDNELKELAKSNSFLELYNSIVKLKNFGEGNLDDFCEDINS